MHHFRPRDGIAEGLRRAGLALVLLAGAALSAQAADRATLKSFLEVTGFDIAIMSLQQGAMSGPALAGTAPDDFGAEWVRLAEKIFDPDEMIERALDMMEAVMPDALVDHGADFYASELGRRLVAAENAAHMTPDEEKYADGEEILGALIDAGSPRIGLLREMNEALGGPDQAIRSFSEVQVRYLLAAIAAGALDIDMSEEELRARIEEQTESLREDMILYSLMANAYAYRDFSDADVAEYLVALEDERMRQVYEVLNAIQFEIMAERYERLAAALADLHPQQDI